MAFPYRDNWHDLQGQYDDNLAWKQAVDDLDEDLRDDEYRRYKEAIENANWINAVCERDNPDADDIDGLHRHAEYEEAARVAACDIANQRYEWHGRWDQDGYKDDDDDFHTGHEEQAENWATRAHNIWKERDYRDLEEEHDYIDRTHAYGEGELVDYTDFLDREAIMEERAQDLAYRIDAFGEDILEDYNDDNDDDDENDDVYTAGLY